MMMMPRTGAYHQSSSVGDQDFSIPAARSAAKNTDRTKSLQRERERTGPQSIAGQDIHTPDTGKFNTKSPAVARIANRTGCQ